MQFFIVSSYLTSFCSLLLGIFVFLRDPRSIINKTFTLLCVSAVVWSLGLSLEVTATNEYWGLFWAKTLHVGVVFLHASFFHFVTAILDIDKQKKIPVYLLYLSSFVFLILIFTSNLFVRGVAPILSFNYYVQVGTLYPVFLAFFFGGVLYGCFLMVKAYNHLTGDRRNQILYFSIASIIGFGGGSTTYLPAFGIKMLPIANYFVFLYTIITAYTIFRYRLMDIKVVIRKTVIYSMLTALLTSVLITIVVLGEMLFREIIGYRSIWTIILGVFIITLIFQPLRDKVQTM